VRLNPATGAVVQTLVPNGSGVNGDEISVSNSGMVYYAVGSGACDSTIYAIPDGGGGTPNPVVSGILPAISPDGTKLAYAVEPGLAQDCNGAGASYPGTAFHVDIRTLSRGTTVSIPELPPPRRACRRGSRTCHGHQTTTTSPCRPRVSRTTRAGHWTF
jgi:hypothetical protein